MRHQNSIMAALLLVPLPALGATQEEVLKGISDGVGESVDPTRLLAVLMVIVGVVLVIAFIGNRRKRQVVKRSLNHPGKLVKEIAKAVNLRPAEVKRLKSLAESRRLSSPLLPLLCPSILRPAKPDAPNPQQPRQAA